MLSNAERKNRNLLSPSLCSYFRLSIDSLLCSSSSPKVPLPIERGGEQRRRQSRENLREEEEEEGIDLDDDADDVERARSLPPLPPQSGAAAGRAAVAALERDARSMLAVRACVLLAFFSFKG